LSKRKGLPIGLLGISEESIPKGKKGWCYFPLGKFDPEIGRNKWIKQKILAIEDIRDKRDVIVADEQGGCKEHTPVELSYQSRSGPYQRVTEDFPLPITAGIKPLLWKTVTATAAGNTPILTPVSGKKIRVHWFGLSNKHGADADVGLRFGGDGDIIHRYLLPASGGNVMANLLDACWQGDLDDVLYAYLAAAYATGIIFNIGYSEHII